MRRIFVDANYWVALINPRDRFHEQAMALRVAHRGVAQLTSDAVLLEVLA